MGEGRRAMSVVVVRSQTMCLLERLAHLGPGAAGAGKKRLEERRRWEREAYRLAHHCQGLGSVGGAFVP